MTIHEISPLEFAQKRKSVPESVLIDVRELEECAEIAPVGAINLPLSTFSVDECKERWTLDTALYMICRSGKRSLRAGQMLAAQGFSKVYNIEGGMNLWEDSSLPTISAE